MEDAPGCFVPSIHGRLKLPYSLELSHNGKTWIGVNTHLPNSLVSEAIKITENSNESSINDNIYLEVKNVSMVLPNSTIAAFPDAVRVRASKHLRELIDLEAQGFRAICLFVIQRDDVTSFAPAAMIDPVYAKQFIEAQKAGVEMLAYHFSPGLQGIACKERIEIIEQVYTS